MNPSDILGVDPSGAHPRPFDARDFRTVSPEIGGSTAGYDWSKPYDIEQRLSALVGSLNGEPTKDQGQAGSCGGETLSYYGQALTIAHLRETTEKSAKAPYSQVYVPGGGSNSRMLGAIYAKQGIFKELLVPSYMNGNPPTEAFMEQASDITQEARNDAAQTAGLFAYSFPRIDLESMATALSESDGMLIGLIGSNNGTWLSAHPSAVRVGPAWAHFMYGGHVDVVDGKKGIWAKQSWGPTVAPETNGWQFLSEDHWNAGNIFDAMVFHYAPTPPATGHVFNTDIHFGATSDEVTQLQTTLARAGVFNLKPTGYYGPITASAIVKFRTKAGVDGSTDPLGRTVGPRTRAALNQVT
jgi:hypothetical protein